MRFVGVFALAVVVSSCGSSSNSILLTTTTPSSTIATTVTTTAPASEATTTTTEVASTTLDPSKIVTYDFENLSGATWWPPDLYLTVQDMTPWDGGEGWSGHSQMFIGADEIGDSIQLIFPVIVDGQYRIELRLTRAPDFGQVEVSIDEQVVDEVDLYFEQVLPSRVIELGPFELAAGDHGIRFTVKGQGPLSTGLKFGIDTITVIGPA